MALQLSISNAIKGFRPYGGGGASLLLDTYTGAAVAYSLRQLRTAYTGAAIRVRRSSDNAEQDINFVGGDLDTASLLSFVNINNMWTYSEELNQASWAKSGTIISANAILAPDSTTTADKTYENTSNANHVIFRGSGTILNATDYNISVFLKQGERTKVLISSGINGSSESCDLDLTNGTISNNTFANTPVVTNEGNDWYRFSVTITSGTTSAANGIRVSLYNALNQINYLGDGVSGIYAWGFQLTQSSSVLTYEKTGASVTKDAYITTWYDQSGNANNATQSTAANQCQIVSSGAVITDPNTGKITSTWTSDRYTLTTGISPNTQYLSIGVVNRTTNTGGINQLGRSSAIGGINGQQPLFWFPTTGNLRSDMSTGLIHDTNTSTGAFIMTSEKNASNLKTAYLNGSALVTTATEAPSAGSNLDVFGQAGSNYTFGRYAEYIYWDSEQSANRTGIEDNINTYWDAY